MAKNLSLEHHRGAPGGVEELTEPVSQARLGRDLARLAYVAGDGTPRVVPIAFTWNGSLDDSMVRIVVKPSWAKVIDFHETLPSAVEELVRRRQERQQP